MLSVTLCIMFMQNKNNTHQSNTSLFQKEYRCISLHVAIRTEPYKTLNTAVQ